VRKRERKEKVDFLIAHSQQLIAVVKGNLSYVFNDTSNANVYKVDIMDICEVALIKDLFCD